MRLLTLMLRSTRLRKTSTKTDGHPIGHPKSLLKPYPFKSKGLQEFIGGRDGNRTHISHHI